jgi:acetyl-CoA C-acetyltransferase
MREAVIVSAARTPIGSFGGSLKGFSSVELGVIAAAEAIRRAGIGPELIDDVIVGSILQAGLGQNIARQIAVKAGVPYSAPATVINMLCGSGLKAAAMAAQAIYTGEADTVLCGGTESMSNAPYLLSNLRWGAKMGDAQMLDTMLKDGLTDAFFGYHMGVTAENIAREYNLTRQEQDEFAVASQNKAEAAIKEGRFNDEIVSIPIPQKKGELIMFNTDEYPRFGVTPESMSKLRPAFDKSGTVTAGNASGINDGAACLVVMAKEKAASLGLKWLASIKGYASAGCKPETMGLGPIFSTRKLLSQLGMSIADIGLIEANEAFAAQSLAVGRELNWDYNRVNVNGGAIALGHPIGASGARILTTLLYELERRGTQTGLATLCVGGGQGVSMVVSQ